MGVGFAGGANPTSHDPEKASIELRSALSSALTGLDPSRVVAGVIGLAGVGKLTASSQARDAFDNAWRDVGLRCPYRPVSDALVAYASGTSAREGSVLIAGTGAIAAAVRGWTLDRVADGHGWLLGDLGSGYWLGREAVRAALAVCDGSSGDGPLAASVRRTLLPSSVHITDISVSSRQVSSALVQAVNSRPPVELAGLAPLVLSAAAAPADPVARSIVDDAADHLVATLGLVHADGLPLVLGGGLLTADNPLAAQVRTLVAERWPGTVAHRAGEGAAAAAWLAARDLPGVDAAALHAALLRS